MKRTASLLAALLLLGLTACGKQAPVQATSAPAPPAAQQTDAPDPSPAGRVADASQMAAVEEVAEEGMSPVFAGSLNDGEYPVAVNSSSSMFRVEKAMLQVKEGKMSLRITMGGKGYAYVYPGKAEEAARAEPAACIPYEEDEEGAHSFTLPLDALDEPFPCAAFSKNKELWYDRTLLARADSLPLSAFREGFFTTAASLKLADGVYMAAVSLAGGSGRASVESPAKLSVKDGACTALIVMSSKNYDYMRLGDSTYLPVNSEGNSAFEIPVAYFDRPISVIADTVAMSEPHEIAYTLLFDSGSLEAVP